MNSIEGFGLKKGMEVRPRQANYTGIRPTTHATTEKKKLKKKTLSAAPRNNDNNSLFFH